MRSRFDSTATWNNRVMTDYDPSEHTVEEVRTYLAEHPEETDAVLAAEADGKNRTTLVNSTTNGEAQVQAKPNGGEDDPTLNEDGKTIDPNTGLPVGEGYPSGEYPETGTFGYSEFTRSDQPTPEPAS